MTNLNPVLFATGEMNIKLDGLERSNAVQELSSTFKQIMVSLFTLVNDDDECHFVTKQIFK